MSLKTSLAWMGWAQAVAVALQFTTSIILAHYLTPYDTGIYGLALATVGVLSLVQSLGLQSMMVREEEITPTISATAFTVNAAISILLSMLIVGASFLGGRALHEEGVQRVLLVLAATPLFGILSFLPSAMLEREGNFRSLAVIGTVSSLSSATATITLAIAGFSYMSVAWAQWVGILVSVATANLLGRRHVSYHIGFAAWRRVASFGFQMVAVTGITQISQRISEICLARLLSLGALGLFNRANGINAIVWNNVHMIAGRVLFVDFAQLHRSGESLRTRYIQVVAMITALLWPAFAGLAIMGKPFIYYIYGPKWIGSYGALVFITLASIGLVASTMTWEIFAATGNLRIQTRIEVVRSLASLATFIAGCFISLEAAAASRVLDAALAFLLYRPHLNRMTQTSLRDFAPIYGQSILLTLAAIAPAFAIMALHGFRPDPPILELVLATATGMSLWTAALALTGHPLWNQARRILNAEKFSRMSLGRRTR